MALISDCCGAEVYSNGDCDTSDFGICPECKEHCEYIDDEEIDETELINNKEEVTNELR